MFVRFCLLLLIAFSVTFQLSAQCGGTYFKETGRQVFSNPFAYSYIEDFDNDGLNDLFGFSFTGNDSYQIHYYKRLSANSFDTTAKSSTLTGVYGPTGVFADVNNDGKKDLIISHSTTPPILTTYLNDGTGRFITNTPAINVNNNENFQIAGDLNNDGKTDVLSTIYNSGTSTLYYRLGQTDLSFGPAVMLTTFSGYLPTESVTERSSAGIIIDDLNNDGLKDISFVSFPSNTLRVLTNTGSNIFNQTLSTNFAALKHRLKAIDLNNDGKKDFYSEVFQDSANPNLYKLKIVSNNGNNTFGNSELIVPIESFISSNTNGDFDGDGDVDILIRGSKKYLLLKNQGSFSFTQQEFKSYQSINSVENIDGDGKADVLTLVRPFLDGYYRLTTPNAIYFQYNAVRFRQNVCNPVGQTKMIDFDGDGKSDRAFWNPSNGVWRYYTEPTENNQVYFQWGSGALGDVPVPNDYDGDGQTDYAIYRKSNGSWWIYRSSDQQVVTINFGLTEDKPIPADYDGDGKADIAVFRPSEGNWYIWLSQSSQYQFVHFGASGDKPVPADYDGDRKADISVFRPSTGVWYRINSSDISFFVYQYGISTDKPVPADFDGDGKANVAVYRDGAWYVLRDNFATSIFNWGLANDIPFWGENVDTTFSVYRKTSSIIYTTDFPSGFARFDSFSTGNSFNETFVSSILPVE